MQQSIKAVNSDSLSVEGLDEVFDVDTTVIGALYQGDIRVMCKSDNGLTIKHI